MARAFHRDGEGHVGLSGSQARDSESLARGGIFGYGTAEPGQQGVSREQAYEWVQRNAMRSFAEQRDFKTLLLSDPDVTRVLPPAEIERAFDLTEQLKHVDHIFGRVFGVH